MDIHLKKKKKREWTQSINTAGCLLGVLCSVSRCRQTLSAFQQFLICAVRKGGLWVQLIPVSVIEHSEQTWSNSDAEQQPKPSLFLHAHLVLCTRKCWDNVNNEQEKYHLRCGSIKVKWCEDITCICLQIQGSSFVFFHYFFVFWFCL